MTIDVWQVTPCQCVSNDTLSVCDEWHPGLPQVVKEWRKTTRHTANRISTDLFLHFHPPQKVVLVVVEFLEALHKLHIALQHLPHHTFRLVSSASSYIHGDIIVQLHNRSRCWCVRLVMVASLSVHLVEWNALQKVSLPATHLGRRSGLYCTLWMSSHYEALLLGLCL